MRRAIYGVLIALVVLEVVIPLLTPLLIYAMIYLGAKGNIMSLPMTLLSLNGFAIFGPLAFILQLLTAALLVRRLWLYFRKREPFIPRSLQGGVLVMSGIVAVSTVLGLAALAVTPLLCRGAGGCSGVPAGLIIAPAFVLGPLVYLYCEARSVFEKTPEVANS